MADLSLAEQLELDALRTDVGGLTQDETLELELLRQKPTTTLDVVKEAAQVLPSKLSKGVFAFPGFVQDVLNLGTRGLESVPPFSTAKSLGEQLAAAVSPGTVEDIRAQQRVTDLPFGTFAQETRSMAPVITESEGKNRVVRALGEGAEFVGSELVPAALSGGTSLAPRLGAAGVSGISSDIFGQLAEKFGGNEGVLRFLGALAPGALRTGAGFTAGAARKTPDAIRAAQKSGERIAADLLDESLRQGGIDEPLKAVTKALAKESPSPVRKTTTELLGPEASGVASIRRELETTPQGFALSAKKEAQRAQRLARERGDIALGAKLPKKAARDVAIDKKLTSLKAQASEKFEAVGDAAISVSPEQTAFSAEVKKMFGKPSNIEEGVIKKQAIEFLQGKNKNINDLQRIRSRVGDKIADLKAGKTPKKSSQRIGTQLIKKIDEALDRAAKEGTELTQKQVSTLKEARATSRKGFQVETRQKLMRDFRDLGKTEKALTKFLEKNKGAIERDFSPATRKRFDKIVKVFRSELGEKKAGSTVRGSLSRAKADNISPVELIRTAFGGRFALGGPTKQMIGRFVRRTLDRFSGVNEDDIIEPLLEAALDPKRAKALLETIPASPAGLRTAERVLVPIFEAAQRSAKRTAQTATPALVSEASEADRETLIDALGG